MVAMGTKGDHKVFGWSKHFTFKSVIGKTPQKLVRMVFTEIGNVFSLSSVYRILEFKLKLSPYISCIQQVHFFKKKGGGGMSTWCLAFFHLGYLKNKEYTFSKICTDGLKRTIIRDMRQINVNTFPGVIENCCHRMLWCWNGKTVILSIFFKLWRYTTSLKNGYVEKMFRHCLNIS